MAASSSVVFTGFVSDDELRRLYAGARAFIFPHVEDFGLVGVEAIACGTPVIAFRAGGAAEIVEDGRTGVFFDEQSPAALAVAVRAFIAREGDFTPAAVAALSSRFSEDSFRDGLMRQIALMRTPSA